MAGLDLTSRSLSKKLDTAGLMNHVQQLREPLTGFNSLESESESPNALALLLNDICSVTSSLNDLAENDIKFPQYNAGRLYKVYKACGILIQESILRLKLLRESREPTPALEHIDEENGLTKRCRELQLRMEMIRLLCSVIDVLSYTITANENTTPHETLATIATLRNRISLTETKISHLDFVDNAELRRAVIIAESAIPVPIHKHFIIPRRTSSIYTRREEEVMIKAAFEDRACFSQKRFVLFGRGGSGKTELALKYAEDFRQLFWGVFFIDGSSRKRASEGYSDIARTVGIEPNEDSAKKWLALQNVPWLLIIDHANTFEVDFEDILPTGRHGRILITSRSPRYNRYGTAGKRYLGVRHMAEEEAIHLVLKAAVCPTPWSVNDKQSAKEVAKAVGSSPLALVAAGNAVKHGICSLTDYLAFHKRHSSLIISHRRKLRENDKLMRSDYLGDEYISIITPFEMLYLSLEVDTQQSSKDALEILNILSYMHFEHIYFDFLLNAALNYSTKGLETNAAGHNGNWLGCFRKSVTARLSQYFDSVSLSAPSPLPLVLRNDKCLNEDEFEEKLRIRLDQAIKVLLQRSLIMIEEGENRYCMQPLVHKWIRGRPSISTAERAYWCGITTAILASNVSALHHGAIGNMEDVDMERELLRHIVHVDDCRKAVEMRLEKNRLARNSFLPILGIGPKRQDTGQAILNQSHPEAKPVETESYTKMVSAPGPLYEKPESSVQDSSLLVLYKMLVFIFLWIVLWICLWSSVNRLLVPLLPSYNKHLIKCMTSIVFVVVLILTVTNKIESGSNSDINISNDYFKGSNSGKLTVNKQKELLTGSLRRSWKDNGRPKEELHSHRNEQECATFTYPTILPHLLDSVLGRVSFLRSEPQLPPGQTRIRWTCVS
ncbi:uncharacterized protein F4817DRAFT_304121 [Daldinia loculata]|uniref:uncharacterized protein n=1 Tax=Daldinia loculata TaxID=103429 RepID=UPI0020C473FF|nr:uncharacterized protein F4817DRAFT_304121 [Daldinia loculata]KAI1642381.1 hypothetical protein F4817DRAFT_304121 [Daldinia loculata]